jgi:hypothetical protein
MLRMPEITGEQDVEVLPEKAEDLGRQDCYEAGVLDLTEFGDLTEVVWPPSRLRLDDFSGEGERAPPE